MNMKKITITFYHLFFYYNATTVSTHRPIFKRVLRNKDNILKNNKFNNSNALRHNWVFSTIVVFVEDTFILLLYSYSLFSVCINIWVRRSFT